MLKEFRQTDRKFLKPRKPLKRGKEDVNKLQIALDTLL